jgi:hypothetical protein
MIVANERDVKCDRTTGSQASPDDALHRGAA